MISKRVVYLKDFADGAKRRRTNGRKTDRFSTGVPRLDAYLGGGFGRKEGWEIVLLFGPTKVGKSFVSLNLLKDAITRGERVGMLVLEDDGEDCFVRLEDMLGAVNAKALLGENIYFTPQENLDEPWKLADLVQEIERWFVEEKLDLILLDHIQFAFENAESIKGENEWAAQRVFMRDLSRMMGRVSKGEGQSKTMIVVSHVNKDGAAKGLGRIAGSGSVPAAATKIIGIDRAKGHRQIELTMYGSRHTDTPEGSCLLQFDKDSVLRAVNVY